MRTRRAPAVFAVAALLTAASASAEDLRVEGVRGSAPWEAGPAEALVASAVYPGLGQLLNGAEFKAVIVGGAEAFLIARLILEDRDTRHSMRLYSETGESRYYDEYSDHYDTRQTLMWWVIGVALYGIADAYVDAHLAGFDEPLRPCLEGSFGESGGAAHGALRVGVVVRF